MWLIGRALTYCARGPRFESRPRWYSIKCFTCPLTTPVNRVMNGSSYSIIITKWSAFLGAIHSVGKLKRYLERHHVCFIYHIPWKTYTMIYYRTSSWCDDLVNVWMVLSWTLTIYPEVIFILKHISSWIVFTHHRSQHSVLWEYLCSPDVFLISPRIELNTFINIWLLKSTQNVGRLSIQ